MVRRVEPPPRVGVRLRKATAASHRVSMGMNSATARFRTADLSDPAQRARPHPQLYSHPLERPSSCSGVDRRLRLLLWAKMILPFASNAHHDHGCTGAVEQRRGRWLLPRPFLLGACSVDRRCPDTWRELDNENEKFWRSGCHRFGVPDACGLRQRDWRLLDVRNCLRSR